MTKPPISAHRPRKRFGQHFLEPAWATKLVRTIAPGPGDAFIEIGPGRGAITRELAAASRKVVAFEIDRDLAASLEQAKPENLTVVEGDFLDITAESLRSVFPAGDLAGAIRVAGNLPYNVASPILFMLLDLFADGVPLSDAYLMLQREVAGRLIGRPGTREYGVLTVLIGHSAGVEKVLSLPPGAFRPPPKVHSAVVRLRFHPPDPPVKNRAVFSALVRGVFTKRRKTLENALGKPSRSALTAAGLDGRRRPETLTIADFVRLADALVDLGLPTPGAAVL